MSRHPNHSFSLGLLFAFAYFVSPMVCSYGGDRYWSGRPQPIGIDLSYNGAVAIYADDTNNFTTLAIALPGEGNSYAQYIYEEYLYRRDAWGSGTPPMIDDTTFMSSFWTWHTSTESSSWAHYTCMKLYDTLKGYHSFCEYCNQIIWPRSEEYVPKKPKSRYLKLLATSQRINQIRVLMPKWFRTSESNKPYTKSNFILSIVELLNQLKAVSIRDHNITITSAVIARPHWVYNELDELIHEACLLADIESIEQPTDRVGISTRTADPGGSLLVIDHGQYFMKVHHQEWDEREEQFAGRTSRGLDEYGTMKILTDLVNCIISNFNTNMTESQRAWPESIQYMDIIRATSVARTQLKYGLKWPPHVAFGNRSVGVNITDKYGGIRSLNMTGQDVLDIESRYVDEVSNDILESVLNREAITEYLKGFPSYQDRSWSEQMDKALQMVKNVPPPEHIGSWIQKIDDIVILDGALDGILLRQAAEKALGWNITQLRPDMCYLTHEVAGRGAALRAIQWQQYYDAEKDDQWMYDSDAELDGEEEHDDENDQDEL